MTAPSIPVMTQATVAGAAAAPDPTLPGADFLAVLVEIGALQSGLAATVAAAAGALSEEGDAAEAPVDRDATTPDAIVDAIGLLLAPPREPVAAVLPAAAGSGASPPALDRELTLRLMTADGEVLEAIAHRDAANHTRTALPDAAAPVAPAETAVARPALDLPESRAPATAQVPVGHPRWADAVGHEVRLLIDRGLQSATLRLTPEQLGPLEVRIEVADDRAQVWFGAAHADTRAALTDAMPRLREMFESAGLQLTDAGVHRDAPRDPQSVPTTHSGRPASPGEDTDASVTLARLAASLVDEYA